MSEWLNDIFNINQHCLPLAISLCTMFPLTVYVNAAYKAEYSKSSWTVIYSYNGMCAPQIAVYLHAYLDECHR